jgi:hypothetical protein
LYHSGKEFFDTRQHSFAINLFVSRASSLSPGLLGQGVIFDQRLWKKNTIVGIDDRTLLTKIRFKSVRTFAAFAFSKLPNFKGTCYTNY